VKRETLKLIETFLEKAEDQPHVGKQFVPPMMEPVLADYSRNVPDARESEVLSLYATIINQVKFINSQHPLFCHFLNFTRFSHFLASTR
jgi:exportin-1